MNRGRSGALDVPTPLLTSSRSGVGETGDRRLRKEYKLEMGLGGLGAEGEGNGGARGR